MGNIRFHVENLIDDAVTLTPSSEQEAWPAANLRHPFRTLTWKAESGTAAHVDIDCGVDGYARALCVINHNLVSGSITVTASDAADFSSPVLETTAEAMRPVFGYGDSGYGLHTYGGWMTLVEQGQFSPDFFSVIYFPSAWARYWRVAFAEPADTGLTAIEVGRIILGDYIEPSRDIQLGYKLMPVDESRAIYAEGGQRYIDRKPKRRKIVLEPSPLMDGEVYWAFFDLLYRIGRRKDLMAVPFHSSVNADEVWFNSIYGHIPDDPPGIAFGGRHRVTLTSPLTILESL